MADDERGGDAGHNDSSNGRDDLPPKPPAPIPPPPPPLEQRGASAGGDAIAGSSNAEGDPSGAHDAMGDGSVSDVVDTGSRPKRRGLRIGIGVGVALIVLAGGAFAAVQVLVPSSVNPADRLPDSLIAYAEINLDPSFDQSPKLLDLLETFDVDEEYDGSDDLIAWMLEDFEVDGVESDDLTSWVGTRGAIGYIGDDLEEPSVILAVASTDDEAAQDGLAAIAGAAEGVQLDFEVDDGLAVLAIGESDAEGRASDVVEAGRAAPLAEDDRYASDVEWLNDDQLLTLWIDYAAGTDLMTDWFDVMRAEAPSDAWPEGLDNDEFMELSNSIAGEYETLVVGIRATGDGVDVRYRTTGEGAGQSGNTDWRADVGELRMAPIAGTATLPDMTGLGDSYIDLMDGLTGPEPERLNEFERGQWSYDEALNEDEVREVTDLTLAWQNGDLEEGDTDYERFHELDNRAYWHGVQSDYDDFIANGGTEDEWFASQALTHQEYAQFLELDDQFYAGSLATEDEQWYYYLDQRLFRFGLVSDYGEWADPAAMVEELYGYISGGTITAVVSDLTRQPEVGLEFVVADGDADRLLDLPIPGWSEVVAEIEREVEFDGNSVTYGELTGEGESLSDHELFDTVFDGAPDEASVALFVDVTGINESSPEPDEELEPVKAAGFVHGSNGEGLLRVIIQD